jgi:hypothetical protein
MMHRMSHNSFAFGIAFLLGIGAPLVAPAENPALPGSAANMPGATSSRSAGSAAGSGALATGKSSDRLREGTKLIDVVGTFQSVGSDSVTFTPGPVGSNKESLRVLENLALQRVSQVLDENKGARLWTVSGDITEYKGANYLLLKKTVIHPQDGDTTAAH